MSLMPRASHILAESIPSEWVEYAACKGKTAMFFRHACTRKCDYEPGCRRLKSVKACLEVCEGCPVLENCRKWAVAELPMGVAGGMTEHERWALGRVLGIYPDREPLWLW